MTSSLWDERAEDLIARTASSSATPGGGSVVALAGAFAVALLRMATAVTADDRLDGMADRAAGLQDRIAAFVDADVAAFEAVIAAYRLPQGSDADRQHRRAAIETAIVAATELPLSVLSDLVEALELGYGLEPVVKHLVLSDVLAGCDLLQGASRGLVRTVDGNLEQLQAMAAPGVASLRERRELLVQRLESVR